MKNDSVFFLGAGFSKAISDSYPDLKNLTKEITSSFASEEDPVAVHYNKDIPDEYKDNIEVLLTYLSSNLPYKTDIQVSLDNALYKDLTKKIADKFNSMPNKFQNFLVPCGNIIHYIWKYSCSCITLNYDLLLENLIFKSFEACNIARPTNGFFDFYHYPINNPYKNNGLSYVPIDIFTRKPMKVIHHKSLPNIIKLHGSINWITTDFNTSGIVYYEEEYNESLLSPFIVPPVLDKTKLYENLTLQKCWYQAFEAIKYARKIFIYGFSFPQTDLAIKFLFQSALKLNPYNPKIYVINTGELIQENSECYAKDRYDNIFQGYNLKFKYCCDGSLELFNRELKNL